MSLGPEIQVRSLEADQSFVVLHPVTEAEFRGLFPLDVEAQQYLTVDSLRQHEDPDRLYQGLEASQTQLLWGTSIVEEGQPNLVGFATLDDIAEPFPSGGGIIARTKRIGRSSGRITMVAQGIYVFDYLDRPGLQADTLAVNGRAQTAMAVAGYVRRQEASHRIMVPYGLEGGTSYLTDWTLFRDADAPPPAGYTPEQVLASATTFARQRQRVRVTVAEPA